MPYIKQQDRERVLRGDVRNSGELNYRLSMIMLEYLHQHGNSYPTCNDILGACSGASKEFYRRIVIPYEDSKIDTNGDVY